MLGGMTEEAYLIEDCPHKASCGYYLWEAQENAYVQEGGRYKLCKRGKWVVLDSKNGDTTILKHTQTIGKPPSSGWQYWSYRSNCYTSTTRTQLKRVNIQRPIPTQSDSNNAENYNQSKNETQDTSAIYPSDTPNVGSSSEPMTKNTPLNNEDSTTSTSSSPPVNVTKTTTFVRQRSQGLKLLDKLELNNLRNDPEGWVQVAAGILTSAGYQNKRTREFVYKMPEAFRRAYHRENQIYSYALKSENSEGEIEIFAPANWVRNNDRQERQIGLYNSFAEYSKFWCRSVRVIEEEIAYIIDKTSRLRREAQDWPKTRDRLKAEEAELDHKLEAVRARERAVQQQSDGLLSLVGRSHIKRDWQQTRVGSKFPAGEDFRSLFLEKLLDFESFACDAVNCLEDLKIPDAASVLVVEVIAPLFSNVIQNVNARIEAKKRFLKERFNATLPAGTEDNIVKLFWYSTQQKQLHNEIKSMIAKGLTEKTLSCGARIQELYYEMERQGNDGSIANDANSIRLDKLYGYLLELYAIAELSDPRCFLQPAPHSFVSYKEGHCMEILSPGTKKFGRIKDGDRVEVVLSGLYFEDSTDKFDVVKPVVPCLVRRLLLQAK